MKPYRSALFLLVISALVTLPTLARAQSLMAPEDSSTAVDIATPAPVDLTYTRPTQETKLHNYIFDAFGPYPILGSAGLAIISQAEHTPSKWQLGAAGYGMRVGSDFGIAAVSTTTRYALAEALKEDTLYYRCECKGVFPRLGHAVLSTVTARHGEDGHRAFSFSAFIAPYAGTMTAVYAWYPDDYGTRAGLRMGNYNLLGSVAENILLEFVYGGPHSLLSRMHLNNAHLAPPPVPAQ